MQITKNDTRWRVLIFSIKRMMISVKQHLLHGAKCSWPGGGGHCAVRFVTCTIRWSRGRANRTELFWIAGSQCISLAVDHLLAISGWRVIRWRNDGLAAGSIQGVVMFEVTLERPRITVALATVLELAFEWLLSWMSQNVAIPAPGNKTMASIQQLLQQSQQKGCCCMQKEYQLRKQFIYNWLVLPVNLLPLT